MKIGQDLAQQLNAIPDDQLAENAAALLDGLKSSFTSVLFSALLSRIQTWIQDPAIQKMIFDKLLELLQKMVTK